jgi:tRNA G46 methylase TrmB
LGLTDFYEKNYSLYYDRPGTHQFNWTRYRQIAEWGAHAAAVGPKRILEVGCGRGWAMAEMSRLFPEAIVKGLEPAIDQTHHRNSKRSPQPFSNAIPLPNRDAMSVPPAALPGFATSAPV